ncbi:HAMP domain-containing histidine kinase, partial [Candidatus Gracilibacteria bacterium]|nr:HAMP domain-containing histidine kinase [Candidatus Gracilibacteria bacterium]
RPPPATRPADLDRAHDLRTPLTVILGQAQLLQRRAIRAGLDERNQRTLDTIAEQAERLNQLIAALLDLSRIQEGRLTIQPESLDLGALLTRVVSEVQSMETVHAVILRPLPSPLILDADPLRLEQVLRNLLSNAVKYSPQGGTITIWAERNGQQVQVHISDQGIGIPDEALPHLFTRFYRAPNATVQTTSSLGIGLFVVRELVHAHGGTITVTTAVDQGSTFTVSLPLLDIQ